MAKEQPSFDVTPRDAVLRAQDIQTSLQGLTGIPSTLKVELEGTLTIGAACRLAMYMQGHDLLNEADVKRLKLIGDTLGVTPEAIQAVLYRLEEAEIIRTVVRNGRIVEIHEKIPYYTDLYARMGEVWDAGERSEIEEAAILALNSAAQSPSLLDDGHPLCALDSSALEELVSVTQQAGIFCVVHMPRDGGQLLYSPLYWEENPEAMYKAVREHGTEEISKLMSKVREHQGLYIDSVESPGASPVARNVVDLGLAPCPTIQAYVGPRQFLFTPYGNALVDPLQRKILDKARAVVACARYGEQFGQITKVEDIKYMLETWLARGQSRKPHSHTAEQYATLAHNGMVRLVPSSDHPDRHYIHLIRTEENQAAWRLGLELLTGGEPITGARVNQQLKDRAFSEAYAEPLTTIAKCRSYIADPAGFKASRERLIRKLTSYEPD